MSWTVSGATDKAPSSSNRQTAGFRIGRARKCVVRRRCQTPDMKPPIPPDPLVLAIGPGGRAGDFIQLRTQMDSAMALSTALRTANIQTSFAIQESVEVPDLAALVVSIGTGLGGVAAVLSAYLRRHQDKAILMERDGTRYELKGMSPDEMETRLNRMLERAAEDQRDTEPVYRDIPGNDDGGIQ